MSSTSIDHDKIKSAMKRAIVKTLGQDDREICSELVKCMEKNLSESKISYNLNRYLNRRDSESLTSRAIRYFEDLQREKYEIKSEKRRNSDRKRESHQTEKHKPKEESNQRLVDLNESVQKRLAALKQSISSRMEDHSNGVILDESGRMVNKVTGQDVEVRRHLPTLQANNRNVKGDSKVFSKKPLEETCTKEFFDPRIKIRGAERSKRPLKLNDPGLFIQRAKIQQSKHQLSILQKEIAKAARKTGIDSVSRIVSVQPENNYLIDHIPDIEWWDSLMITSRSYCQALSAIEADDLSTEFTSVGKLIEHPKKYVIPSSLTHDAKKGIVVPLTKKERRKLRRQSRLEAQKEFQEKIRLGLVTPPEPKVRMANLMRVLGSEAVQDPTKVEAHVRNQMAKRERAHKKANAQRKLTADQAREKVIRKISEDTSAGVHVLLFRVPNLSSASHRFKIEANCRQLLMTGFVALLSDCNVIVVEGGPKQTRKFLQLMMKRIRWDKVKKTAEGRESENTCTLVWRGVVEKRAFSDLKFKNCPTATFAREQFRKFGVENYWDLCYCSAVLQEREEDS